MQTSAMSSNLQKVQLAKHLDHSFLHEVVAGSTVALHAWQQGLHVVAPVDAIACAHEGTYMRSRIPNRRTAELTVVSVDPVIR